MSNPIPLSSPDGVLYGYACGNCHQITVGMTSSAEEGKPNPTTVETNRQYADACCRCARCKLVKKRSFDGVCDDCRPAREAEIEAAHAAYALKDAPKKALRDAALAQANDKDAAQMLCDLMSDISERYWCAGWLNGLEYRLWEALKNQDMTDECFSLKGYEVVELRRLHEKCGGWWVYDNEIGEKFVTTEEWLGMVEASRR